MSKRKVPEATAEIRGLLASSGEISSGEVARALGVTRQAAYYHLARLAEAGEVRRIGGGRSSRYTAATAFSRRYSLANLSEHVVWREVADAVPAIGNASGNLTSILSYAFTEMLNNAIDHSGGENVDVRIWVLEGIIAFELVDDGIGVFRSIGMRMGLASDLESLQELEKGKATTAPSMHSGEGIFFTSRVVDLFTLEGGRLRWTVDNRRQDIAVGEIEERRGTRVRCEVDVTTRRSLRDVFDRYTSDADAPSFDRTSIRVKLYELGDRFVSRSEAKRLSHRLEGFSIVEVDFSDVREIGQGFADELFRVWASAHPETSLIPINASAAINWMIDRVRG
jgi:DNA-binding transcriptional ArsR family regulator